jgi:hypothetical protein
VRRDVWAFRDFVASGSEGEKNQERALEKTKSRNGENLYERRETKCEGDPIVHSVTRIRARKAKVSSHDS